MNKDELNNLLDNIYELEGLVHLAIARDDCPESLPQLIAQKGAELSERANKIADQAIPVLHIEGQPDLQEEAPLSFEECPTDTVTKPLSFEERTNAIDDQSLQVVQEPAELVSQLLPLEEETISPVEDHFPEHGSSASISDRPKGKLVFSINDRYRFKRELFDNSDANFNTHLSLVASMDCYDEAEDYFLNELQWDPASPEVIGFLKIIQKYFNS